MQLINKQNNFLMLFSDRQNFLQSLLKLPAIFRPSNHRRQIQLKKSLALQKFGNFIISNPLRQTLNDRSFTDAGFANQRWIILASPAQNRDHSLYFRRSTNHRIQKSFAGTPRQIDTKFLQNSQIARIFTRRTALALKRFKLLFIKHIFQTSTQIINVNIHIPQQFSRSCLVLLQHSINDMFRANFFLSKFNR